jgi:NADH:ubiquinone oxidoreductase subunit F (NADH-binding)
MRAYGDQGVSAGFLLPPAPIPDLDTYLSGGGGEGLRAARRLGPSGTIRAVRDSGLRGRGGAGFPTGFKWQGLVDQQLEPTYLVCNAAEGEPGTFKDRALLRSNPYQLLEGIAIAGEALGVEQAFLGIKASFASELARLESAADEMREAGLLGEVPLTIVPGPDDYLFGEEKALLEVIEGNDPLPRLDPPYIRGLFTSQSAPANPAVVNNVETLSNVPHILREGPQWFRSFGTERSPGTMVFTVSGDVRREAVAELALGTPLAVLIYGIGEGPADGRSLKAVVSGASNAPLSAQYVDLPLDYESFRAAGCGLGSGSIIVYDDTASMVDAALVLSSFLASSSCGQCPPCKLGTAAITERLEALAYGVATELQLEELAAWLGRVTDANRCGLGAGERSMVGGFLETFWDEFAAQVERGVPVPRRLQVPLIVDYDDAAGRFTYA